MPVGAKLRVPLPRRTLLARARLANPFRADGPLPRLVLDGLMQASFNADGLCTTCRLWWQSQVEPDTAAATR